MPSTQPDASVIYKNVLFDNSWQFFISMSYLLINSLLSTFFVTNELAGYAKDRKTLRVSAPTGIQRSSYFVSMPARYGLPLMITIGLLHWTVSQSIFVICIDRYFSNGSEDTVWRYVTSGFSLVAVLACELHYHHPPSVMWSTLTILSTHYRRCAYYWSGGIKRQNIQW